MKADRNDAEIERVEGERARDHRQGLAERQFQRAHAGLPSSADRGVSNLTRPAIAVTLLEMLTEPIAALGGDAGRDHSSRRRSDGAANFAWPSK